MLGSNVFFYALSCTCTCKCDISSSIRKCTHRDRIQCLHSEFGRVHESTICLAYMLRRIIFFMRCCTFSITKIVSRVCICNSNNVYIALLQQRKPTSRLRSSTVPTRPLSSTRVGKKKEEPEFMKEFKSKKKSTG